MSEKADYGVDAPSVIRGFILAGVLMIAVGVTGSTRYAWLVWVKNGLVWWGASWIVTSLFMVLYSKFGKFRHRDRMLALVDWKGDETVLDVGTGRGLLMIGAAKKLTNSGKSIGIDIWNAEDLSGNKMENTMRNVRAEGVESKIELRSEDVRQMSFPAASFDVILSNLCIHNLYKKEQREQACREIARVLKPGGVAVISDFRHIAQYAESLGEAGLSVERLGPYWKDTFPKLSIVLAAEYNHSESTVLQKSSAILKPLFKRGCSMKNILKTAVVAGLAGLALNSASAEKLPAFKQNAEDFFYAQQTSLWIFNEVPRQVILSQVGDELSRLGFELVSFDGSDNGTIILKPMIFTGEFGSQDALAPGISSSTEVELTVLVRPRNKAPVAGSLESFILGTHPDKNIGQLRLDVLCDDPIAVAAGRKNFGEHKFLGSFEYSYPTPNTSVGAAQPFSLDMTAYTFQGAGQVDHKMFRIQADLTGLKAQHAKFSPEYLFAAFPAEPSPNQTQHAIGEYRHYGRSLTAYLAPAGYKGLTLSFGQAQGAQQLKPVAPFGDGNPIPGSETWPTEMRDRVQSLLSQGTVAGYLLFRMPSVEYEPKPFEVF